MFFKNLLDGISQSLDVDYRSHLRTGMNSADLGELCEFFAKNFLKKFLDDHYKVFRGGNVVNVKGNQSPQLDIILTNKNSLKIFEDKGLYPIETLIGVFSITSNLTLPKLKDCLQQLNKIPKHGFCFDMEKFYGEKFEKETHEVWKNTVPFSCIFGFSGDIKESWIDELNNHLRNSIDKSLCPTIVMVNKKSMFEKFIKKTPDGEVQHYYEYVPFEQDQKYGYPFSKILYGLYILSAEQNYRRPDYANYFNQDY
jgi:hypothetical protein